MSGLKNKEKKNKFLTNTYHDILLFSKGRK